MMRDAAGVMVIGILGLSTVAACDGTLGAADLCDELAAAVEQCGVAVSPDFHRSCDPASEDLEAIRTLLGESCDTLTTALGSSADARGAQFSSQQKKDGEPCLFNFQCQPGFFCGLRWPRSMACSPSTSTLFSGCKKECVRYGWYGYMDPCHSDKECANQGDPTHPLLCRSPYYGGPKRCLFCDAEQVTLFGKPNGFRWRCS
jgi:hypothetical protein